MKNKDLREYKTRKNLTAKALAERLGVPKRSVDNWLQGRYRVPASVGKVIELLENNK